jgi:carbonic anhydrase
MLKRSLLSSSGSLTTPPCTEPIRWLVLARPITVSKPQLDALDDVVDGNVRPRQPGSARSLILF